MLKKWRVKVHSLNSNIAKVQSHSVIYETVYSDVLSSGLVGFMTKLLHRDMEQPFKSTQSFNLVLEIGAGDGVHRPFVKHKYLEYWETDLRYKKIKYESFLHGLPSKLVKVHLDAEDLSSIRDNHFNRIIATCVLLHLRNIESALVQWRRVVADGGVITIYVPSEPGLFLSMAQFLTTKRKFEKQGVDYCSWQFQEHITSFPRAQVLISKVFMMDEISVRKFPTSLLPWHFSLWAVYQIKVKKLEDGSNA
jgi:SAM-dependent methyltransferase